MHDRPPSDVRLPTAATSEVNSGSNVVLLSLSWLAAANTRWALISVAPLLPLIAADLHLSGSAVGILFGLPVFLMGLMAIPGGALADRVGPTRTVALGLGLLAIGGGARALTQDFSALLVATLLVGLGSAVIQPALPRIVRLIMAARAGVGTAIYASGFTLGALIAAAISIPWLYPAFGDSWRMVLLFWAALGGISLVAWLAWARVRAVPHASDPHGRADGVGQPLRNPLLWLIAAIFLLQTLIFYTLIAWIVPYFLELGSPLATATIPLAALNFGSLLGGFSAPVATDYVRARRPVIIGASTVALIGCCGLLLWPLLMPAGWAALTGFGVAGVFTTSLALPVDVAARQHVGAASGVVLSVGYGGAALGLPASGALHDLTGGHAVTVAALTALCGVMLISSLVLPETHPLRARGGSSQSRV